MDILKIGSIQAAPGEKARGYLEVPGTDVKIPLTLIHGAREGKTVVITGGTHGGEYPGIETSIRLARDLKPENVHGRVIVVHPVNTPAFFAKLQYIGPHDGKNLNRMFPGQATGTVTQRIAYAISSQLFTIADYYFDLHGGDLHEALEPFVIYSTLGSDEQNALSLKLAKALGIRYVCASISANGTFGCAATMGVAGFLGEIGQCGLWSEADVASYYDGILNVLRLCGTLYGDARDNTSAVQLERMVGLEAQKTGCWYPSVKPGEQVTVHEKVGEIRDCFGDTLQECAAPETGVVLYVASSLAIMEGDPLVAVGKIV